MQVLTPPLQHPCWEWGLSSPLPPCPGTRACWGVRAGSGSLSEWKEPQGGPLAGQVLRGSWNLDSQRLATARRFEAARVRGGGWACTFPRSCHRVRRERSPCAQLPRPPLSISVSVARSPAGPLLGPLRAGPSAGLGRRGRGPPLSSLTCWQHSRSVALELVAPCAKPAVVGGAVLPRVSDPGPSSRGLSD